MIIQLEKLVSRKNETISTFHDFSSLPKYTDLFHLIHKLTDVTRVRLLSNAAKSPVM